MNKLGLILFAGCVLVAGCGDDDTTSPSNAPRVVATQLSPANEVPAITNSEASARGSAQVSFEISGSTATATMYFQATGLPPGTNIVGAHIHPGAAGVNGPVIVNTGVSAAAPVTMSGNAVEYSARVGLDPALAQMIISNPAGYYFNIHTTTNPGGVARGQLSLIQ